MDGACELGERVEHTHAAYALAFDTANEVIAIGAGKLDVATCSVRPVACVEVAAHRASNTQLLPRIDALLAEHGIDRSQIACVCVGRGPGSFTGVRIAMATAKGVSSALGVPLVGLSTQAAVAQGARLAGVRGRLLVVGDAMRKEVYPALFRLDDDNVERLSPDRVVKAAEFAEEVKGMKDVRLAGDALAKYATLFDGAESLAPSELWAPTGEGLLAELQALWRAGDVDPMDARRHDPVAILPVYTRLSDAEENERARLAVLGERNLETGVQGATAAFGDSRVRVEERPFDVKYAADAAAVEHDVMGADAWTQEMFVDDLSRKNRTWWMALKAGGLVGYAGGLLSDGDMQLLKIATVPKMRRAGVARGLLARVAEDAENLAATTMSLEVRASNEGAQAFYESMGFSREGVRPGYYSDGEDAVIMRASLPLQARSPQGSQGAQSPQYADGAVGAEGANDAAGMEGSAGLQDPLTHGVALSVARPLILAIESSCDETAASVIDGCGRILSSVVSSQVDFHARFGGVVPEIASRKHVEAIVGVTRLALAEAAQSAGASTFSWQDLDAVGVTYAPGLVGALVVGVAFAKGAAWAAGIPVIAVNHLEGHLYANKLSSDFQPPAVVSLVSGGNTMLVHMRGWQDYEVLGATIDDAVGEAFDKVAKALGFPYPGGPIISEHAKAGNPCAVDFPRALMHSGDYRFSLSGLKTAVITHINKVRESGDELNLPDICASFQQAVIDVQVAKAKRALEATGARTFCLGGGVAANPALREAYEQMCASIGVRVVMPPLSACGDNAAMIALVALDRFKQGKFADLSQDAFAHANLEEAY